MYSKLIAIKPRKFFLELFYFWQVVVNNVIVVRIELNKILVLIFGTVKCLERHKFSDDRL